MEEGEKGTRGRKEGKVRGKKEKRKRSGNGKE